LLHELGTGNGSANAGANAAAPYDPGALPLLSHSLQGTWEHREDRTLTVAGYQATGGIRGAVAATAEATFQAFDFVEQQAARRLLLRMVQIGDGVADTRLRADRNTLIEHSPDPAAASTVFDAFAHARLITADEDAAEITHEALLRAWPRLRGWIDADRAGLYIHQRLTDAAQRWDRDGRPTCALYRDTDLAVAQDWAQEPAHHDDLGTLERDFLVASQALRARQQQKSHRRTRQLITSLVVLLVLSLVGGGIALYQANHPRPRLALSTSQIKTGDTYLATASGFSPKENVQFSWIGPTSNNIGVFPADSQGIATRRYLQKDPPGNYTITVNGQTSRRTASAALRVVTGSGDTPRLVLSTSQIKIGDTYLATASGFLPGEDVQFSWTGPTSGTLMTSPADSGGNTTTGTIVETDDQGNYTILAVGRTSGRVATAALQVVLDRN